jgi:O-antigen ligase
MLILLAILLAFGVLTLWVPAAWAVAAFEIGVFSIAVWAVCRIRRQPPIFSYPLLPFFLAVMLGLFQLFTHQTAYAFETTQSVVKWLTFLAVFLVATAALREDQAVRQFQEALLWFGSVVALVATLQTFTGEGKIFWLFAVEYSDVAVGPILSRNHYSAFVELLLPLAIYRALRSKERGFLYAGMAAVLYASVIAAASRAGMILSTAGIVLVVVLVCHRGLVAGRQAGVVLGRVAALLVLFTVIVGWQAVWNRLMTPDPMAFRQEFDISSLQMIKDHPWLGVGMGAWPTAYPKYAIFDSGAFVNQAHCDWLQWTAEGGIVFGLSLLALFVWSLRLAWKTIWGLGIISVFLHACVDYPFSRPALGSFFVVMLALLAAFQAKTSKSVAPESASLRRNEESLVGGNAAA